MLKQLLFLSFLGSLFLTGCFFSGPQKTSGLQEFKGEAFGSYYLIKLVGELDQEKFRRDLEDFFKGFNEEFSTYQRSSVVSQLNLALPGQRLKVSGRFIDMLKLAKRFSDETKGAFGPTLGPVIKLWGFGGGKKLATPSEANLKTALGLVGLEHIHWDEKASEAWKTKQGVELDLNAFAPGWAADFIGKMLEAEKVTNYMVDISGELVIKGEKAPGKSWIIAIEKPSENYAEGVQLAFRARDLAVATSGDYRQFFNEKGERRSHIIDPRTGRPVTHSISSATVIADTGARADAWSTALMVLGKEGIPLAEANGVKVYLLEALGPKEFRPITSPSMDVFMEGAILTLP